MNANAMPARFFAKVAKSGDCWIWSGARGTGGYGRFRVAGRTREAHRVAYLMLVGPIPDGLQLDHLCRVRSCVNPAHLEPVTSRENTRRGVTATKTHCVRDHPFDALNTYVDRNGHRWCRACWRLRSSAYKRRLRAQAVAEVAL